MTVNKLKVLQVVRTSESGGGLLVLFGVQKRVIRPLK